MTELYAILVLKFNLSPDYVLDRMRLYEAKALLKYSDYSSRDSWEQSRLVAYLIAQTNSTKKMKPSDIIKFSWDNEYNGDTSISNEEIERLKAKAAAYQADKEKNLEIRNG